MTIHFMWSATVDKLFPVVAGFCDIPWAMIDKLKLIEQKEN